MVDDAKNPLDALAGVVPPLVERLALLDRWATKLSENAEVLAQAITTATNKPIQLSRSEVERALITLHGTIATASTALLPEVVAMEDAQAVIHRVPRGPVLAVTPFNFPLNLAMHKLAPALAAGCPVLWKPSPQAPGVAERAAALWSDAGASDGLLRVVHLSNDAVAEVCRDPRLGMLSFTGSHQVGQQLRALCATNGAQVTLELGGNTAVILHEVSDLHAVARAIARGACAHAGQVCISIQRIFIPAARPDWRAALVAAFREVPTGDPRDERTICGPVISGAAKERISAILERYRAAGGRVLIGGEWQARMLSPTLIDGVPANHPDVRETEVFAPIATLHEYSSLDEALYAAEDTPFGLQAGLFTHDEAAIERAFAWLTVGTLVVNDVPSKRDDRLPYGGMKASGCGREGTLETVREYTVPKVLWRAGHNK